MGEWVDTTIGDQVVLQRGVDITRAAQRDGTVPVVSSGGVSSYHDTAVASGPGVVLGRKGVVGSVFYMPMDYWPHDTTLWVKDFRGNVARFVYYFFRARASQLLSMDVGSANPTLNRNHVHPIKVRWPDVPSQRTIAAVLGAIDDKIEVNRRMAETLEEMARALFRSWFVDFDPVRAKAEGRDTGLPPEISDLFPDRFVDSPLGDIPEGWSEGRISDVAELNPESWRKGGMPDRISYLDLSNVKWGRISEVIDYATIDAPSRAQRILRRGDVVVGTVRPGNGSFARIGVEGLTGSTGFAVLRAKDARDAGLVYLAVTAIESIDRLTNLADGGAYPAVRPQVVADAPVAIPGIPVRSLLATVVDPILEQVAALDAEIRSLAELRDTLLPKLVSGEVRIGDPVGFLERLEAVG